MEPRPQVILVVDDEADIVDSLKSLLEDSIKNVRVVISESGTLALEMLRTQPVDIILSDYKMPGLNGLEFLAEAKKIAPNVPRILITAFPDLELALRAINEAKIENFLTKPFEPGVAVDTVRNVLAAKKADEQRKQAFARSLDQLRRGSKAEK